MKTKETTYNGWTNYPTWRIKLELWDDDSMWSELEPFDDIYSFSEYLKETTEEMFENYIPEGNQTANMVLSYALAFISDVNWYDIAQHIAEDYPQIIKKN